VIGATGGSQIRVTVGGRLLVDLETSEAERLWSTAIERRFVRKVA
jgi:hypothetical protein